MRPSQSSRRKNGTGQDLDAVVGQASPLLVADHELPPERDLVREGQQALVVAGGDARLGLHLDRHRVTDDEVHLKLRPAPPVAERLVPAAVVEEGAQLEEDQVLQRAP
jgi:hypothetical protein